MIRLVKITPSVISVDAAGSVRRVVMLDVLLFAVGVADRLGSMLGARYLCLE